jgi:hypothetical protein
MNDCQFQLHIQDISSYFIIQKVQAKDYPECMEFRHVLYINFKGNYKITKVTCWFVISN